MKSYIEIKSIIDAQDELDMLSKPEGLTIDEFNYYLMVDKLQNEINLKKSELDQKQQELTAIINNPNHFKYNEGL